MFGLNDNNKPEDNSAPPADSLAPKPNPFGDDASSLPAAAPPAPIPAPPAPAPSFDPPQPAATTPSTSSPDGLLDLKGQALNSLQPLLGHLEQSPEEKFKTTMMMIQATDNPSLVKQAYEAAGQISDEKARAQALLDVVNEINYFTQRNKGDGPKPKTA